MNWDDICNNFFVIALLEPHKLRHYVHFMEAAFGLGIAFSLFEDVHGWGLKVSEQKIDKIMKRMWAPEQKKNTEAHIKDIINGSLQKEKKVLTNNLSITIPTLKLISGSVGIMFFLLLAFVGIYHEISVPLYLALLLILLGTLPLFFILWIYLKWKKYFAELKKNEGFYDNLISSVTIVPPSSNHGPRS